MTLNGLPLSVKNFRPTWDTEEVLPEWWELIITAKNLGQRHVRA